MTTPLCASCGDPLPTAGQRSVCGRCDSENIGPAASWVGNSPAEESASMGTTPQRNQPEERGQTCLFCSRNRDPELAVYSMGVGRLGICLDCARKAVEVLQTHEKAEATV